MSTCILCLQNVWVHAPPPPSPIPQFFCYLNKLVKDPFVEELQNSVNSCCDIAGSFYLVMGLFFSHWARGHKNSQGIVTLEYPHAPASWSCVISLVGTNWVSTLAGCLSILPLGTSCRLTLCRSILSLHPAPILPLIMVTTPNGYALPSCPYIWESFHLIVISELSSVMAFPAVSLGLQEFKFWAQLFWQFGSSFGLPCPLPSHCRRWAPVCCRGRLLAFIPSFRLGLILLAFSYIFFRVSVKLNNGQHWSYDDYCHHRSQHLIQCNR